VLRIWQQSVKQQCKPAVIITGVYTVEWWKCDCRKYRKASLMCRDIAVMPVDVISICVVCRLWIHIT